MVFKFTILSDEADHFVRVISIDSEATFLELHHAILDSMKYQKDLLTTFFLCADDWEKEQEVTLIEMDTGSEYDNLVMEDTKLEDLISDEKQKLIYVFDLLTERAFYMELSEIVPGISMDKPECILSKGEAPAQTISDEELIAGVNVNIDENFYGDEDFDLSELDDEGFDNVSFDDSSMFDE
jgi:hypothetical protein